MAQGDVPQAVLAERLAECLDGRKVRAAVFTTYSFDPGFFELHVLPLLFDTPFSQIEKVKRIQLEDALRSVEEVAVYYDRTALSQDALPAQLDFRRLGVRVPTGIFHPKLILILVENPTEKETGAIEPGPESLIVGALSANLTRAGWWENLEVGHFETLDDKDWSNRTYPFRDDLLKLTRRLYHLGYALGEQLALQRIRAFLLKRVPTHAPSRHSARGRHYTRLFFGQSALPAWLNELRLGNRDWNLEVISPYFGGNDAGTVARLVDVLNPKEMRVYCPRDLNGAAGVTAALYEAMQDYGTWATLPQALTRPGARGAAKGAAPRFVHAKIYRLWQEEGKQVVLVGSVNLTSAAHSQAGAGNLEASFLVDLSGVDIPARWWLQPLDQPPDHYAETDPGDTDESAIIYVDISLRFDWGTGALTYRVEGEPSGPLAIQDPSGHDLFSIPCPVAEQWVDCGREAAEKVRERLVSTSFLRVVHPQGSWRVLVCEEGMSHRPSLFTALTPEEILMYWSLLSEAQKEAFITEKLASEAQLQGLTTATRQYAASDTIFDRFAGIYHAFEQLYHHVTTCLQQGEESHAIMRLFGAKYDSLPELLRKTLEQNEDAVMRYIIFLCAKQICNRIQAYDRDFWNRHRRLAEGLESLLRQLPSLAASLPLEGVDQAEFIAWYERMFIRMIGEPEEAA